MITKTLETLPNPIMTYGNVVKTLLPLENIPFNKVPVLGKKLVKTLRIRPRGTKGTLPEVTYIIPRFSVDIDHLHNYNAVCGFRNDKILPPTYLCVISQTLQMNMMSKEAFPYALLGMVHIKNSITQHRPIAQYETIELSCSFGELRPHDKGQQFDFITTAKVADELVYEASSTYLMRGKSNGEKKQSEKQPKPTPSTDDIHAIWQVPENIGRNYARVSGDFNFIHLHTVTAKAFGFKTAIAHGMWSMARSVVELGDLPDAFELDVAFKLPIFLPSKVELIANQLEKQQSVVNFNLYDAKSDKPHLSGVLTKL